MDISQAHFLAPARDAGKSLAPTSESRIRAAAQALETSFLSEMLKGAGFGQTRESFGGGAGEEQFASLLRDEQARVLVQGGGIGLTAIIAARLEEQTDV